MRSKVIQISFLWARAATKDDDGETMITTTKCKGEQGNEKIFPGSSNERVSFYFSSKTAVYYYRYCAQGYDGRVTIGRLNWANIDFGLHGFS